MFVAGGIGTAGLGASAAAKGSVEVANNSKPISLGSVSCSFMSLICDYSRCFQLRDMVAKLAALGKGFLPQK